MESLKINLYSLLLCLSHAQEIVSSSLFNHNQQVVYLSFKIAEYLDFPQDKKRELFYAALIHDIGALTDAEKPELVESESPSINNHSYKGAKLLKDFKPLKTESEIIKYHHTFWEDNNESIPIESHIIHLADRTCMAIDSNINVLIQVPNIIAYIKEKSNTMFHPEIVNVIEKISINEYIWLDLVSSSPLDRITGMKNINNTMLGMNDVLGFSLILSQVIDFRSRFTACHSAGVAEIASKLAFISGSFSAFNCKMMLVAGYLHDLGKISIRSTLLDKPDKLNFDEICEMRKHTYYTYHILRTVPQLSTINEWASYHHEKLNGKGYPFHLTDKDLSLGARIMAVADIFTAITEDRPYRKGMDATSAKILFSNMVKNGDLDNNVVNLLLDNYDVINNLRIEAQVKALKRYKNFKEK